MQQGAGGTAAGLGDFFRTRNAGLDVLRFLAVLLVMIRHVPLAGTSVPALRSVLAFVQTGGWIGVDLFFVLSGFLVSGLIFAEYKKSHEVRLGRFLLRRGFKIYPAFWVNLVFVIVVLKFFNPDFTGLVLRKSNLVGELVFLQNYLGRLTPITWSLAVEEHFYLLLALVCSVVLRRKPAQPFAFVPKLYVLTVLGCFAARLASWLVLGKFNGLCLIFGTHARLDSLMAGVLLSYAMHFYFTAEHFEKIRRARWWLMAAGAALFLPAFLWDANIHYSMLICGYPFFALGGIMLVAAVVCAGAGKPGIFTRVVAAVGARSYSVYLWHYAVLGFSRPLFAAHQNDVGWLAAFTAYLAGCWAVGIIMAQVVEFPVLRLRDRLMGRERPLSIEIADGTRGGESAQETQAVMNGGSPVV